MLQKIQTYIQQHNIANTGTPILVACSGGVDSMVLVDVLLKLNYTISIAHCNFQLRGKESDADEAFVQEFCSNNKLHFFSVKFDTSAYNATQTISTQMAARALRYGWFEQIRKANGFHTIATAHHLDDQMETVLLNMSKGTGLRGLTGMEPKHGAVIRPMLEIAKTELINYAKENHIAFREDSSNGSDDYQRNAIRHQVVPQLRKINPSLHHAMMDFINRMKDYEVLTNEQIQSVKRKCFSEKNGIAEIKTGYIKSHRAGQTILFHLLNDYGFNSTQTSEMFRNLEVLNSGKQFFSDTHRIVFDRKRLFIVSKNASAENYLAFDKIPNKIIFNNYKIACSILPVKELNIKTSGRYAYIDADKIEFPIMIRYAGEGDYFIRLA
jgi:tRNA(Ile)-lysidine synthase